MYSPDSHDELNCFIWNLDGDRRVSFLLLKSRNGSAYLFVVEPYNLSIYSSNDKLNLFGESKKEITLKQVVF